VLYVVIQRMAERRRQPRTVAAAATATGVSQ
jgi:hypothetical protein